MKAYINEIVRNARRKSHALRQSLQMIKDPSPPQSPKWIWRFFWMIGKRRDYAVYCYWKIKCRKISSIRWYFKKFWSKNFLSSSLSFFKNLFLRPLFYTLSKDKLLLIFENIPIPVYCHETVIINIFFAQLTLESPVTKSRLDFEFAAEVINWHTFVFLTLAWFLPCNIIVEQDRLLSLALSWTTHMVKNLLFAILCLHNIL